MKKIYFLLVGTLMMFSSAVMAQVSVNVNFTRDGNTSTDVYNIPPRVDFILVSESSIEFLLYETHSGVLLEQLGNYDKNELNYVSLNIPNPSQLLRSEFQFAGNDEDIFIMGPLDDFNGLSVSGNNCYLEYWDIEPGLPGEMKTVTADLNRYWILLFYYSGIITDIGNVGVSENSVFYANGSLNIESSAPLGEVVIYSLSGVAVKSFNVSGNSLSANLNLPSGLYIAKFGSNNVKFVVP